MHRDIPSKRPKVKPPCHQLLLTICDHLRKADQKAQQAQYGELIDNLDSVLLERLKRNVVDYGQHCETNENGDLQNYKVVEEEDCEGESEPSEDEKHGVSHD